jgi:hypothetical protein
MRDARDGAARTGVQLPLELLQQRCVVLLIIIIVLLVGQRRRARALLGQALCAQGALSLALGSALPLAVRQHLQQ